MGLDTINQPHRKCVCTSKICHLLPSRDPVRGWGGSKDPLSKRSYLFSPLQAGFGRTLMAKYGHTDIAKQPTSSSGKLGLLLTMREEIVSQRISTSDRKSAFKSGQVSNCCLWLSWRMALRSSVLGNQLSVHLPFARDGQGQGKVAYHVKS